MIHSFLQPYTDKINDLCQQHSVVRLYAFGSVTSEEFDEHKSDVDLLVDFSDKLPPERKGEIYFTLLFELEKLFHRRVDLVMGQSFRNPYFACAVEQSKQLLFNQTTNHEEAIHSVCLPSSIGGSLPYSWAIRQG